MNLSNRAARKPTQNLIDLADAAGQNFPRLFLLPCKDLTQSIDDLSFDFLFCECVHVCNHSSSSSKINFMSKDQPETSASDFFPERKSLKAFRDAAADC